MSKKTAKKAANQLVKLFVKAGQATPGPPIGPALGSKGVKAIDFCKQFNDQSLKTYKQGVQVRARLTIKSDRTFSMEIRPPSTSYLLKKAASIDKGAGKTGHEVAGKISVKHLYEIAKIKQKDPNMEHLGLESICELVSGSARSMGIKIQA